MEDIHLLSEETLSYLIHLEDGCYDPDMKDNIQALRLLMSILKPCLRFLMYGYGPDDHRREEFWVQLKHIVDVLQKVCWAFEPCPLQLLFKHRDDDASTTTTSELLTSNLEILKSLKKDIARIITLPHYSCGLSTRDGEELLRFIRSLIQNLKDITNITCKETKRTIRVMKELARVVERLEFLATSLWLTFNVPKSKNAFISAKKLATTISYRLFLCFVGDELVSCDHIKEDLLLEVIREISALLPEIRQVYDDAESVSTRFRLPANRCNMEEHIPGFTGCLVHKLRELSNNNASFMVAAVKTQIYILVDELRFMIDSSLVDMLCKYPLFSMQCMTDSIETLIFHTGFFIYFSLDKHDDEEFIMANYLSSGLPDLLNHVDTVHQQARAEFREYFLQSCKFKCPTTDELEFIDFLVEKLDRELLKSQSTSNDPLKHQIVMVHEEMVTLRKYFSEMTELGYSQTESLLTRFRDAAYLAEFATYSFSGGEYSLWNSKLGLFVVTKDLKVMQEEIKSILKLACVTSFHNNIAVAPSCASSQASIPPSISGAIAPEVHRDLLPIRRYNLTEQADIFRRNRQHGRLSYGSIIKYKNLRMLDLGNVQIQSSAETSDLMEIAKLVQLKYLAVRVRTTEIPSEIGNLQSLETFILTGAIGEVMLPEAMWKLVSLRNVIMDHCFFSVQHYSQEFFEDSSQLDNLKSISTLCICPGNVEKFTRRILGVQKLGCIFSTSWLDCYEASNLFKVFEILLIAVELKDWPVAVNNITSRRILEAEAVRYAMEKAKEEGWSRIEVEGRTEDVVGALILGNIVKGQRMWWGH
ncbi:hypothetical protein ACH5RR_026736 [Cinchona calisaya]|uniref:Uncharacterized protein n=1 Tax=Cinchona calisaya TaxID=153742 RepID=A0ABD2Z3G6_9GENT